MTYPFAPSFCNSWQRIIGTGFNCDCAICSTAESTPMDGDACHSDPSHWDHVGSIRCNGLLGIDNAVHCRQSTTVGSDGYWFLRQRLHAVASRKSCPVRRRFQDQQPTEWRTIQGNKIAESIAMMVDDCSPWLRALPKVDKFMSHYSIIAVLCSFCMLGCDGPFSRAIPKPNDFIHRFLAPRFQPETIFDLQYSYQGAVGGESSIARFQLTRQEVERIKAEIPDAAFFGPASEKEIDELKKLFAFCARGGSVPKWFDFPFDKSLLLFEGSGDDTDIHPDSSHKWYVDEERCVVYFVMIEG